jgi:hypothetical protein
MKHKGHRADFRANQSLHEGRAAGVHPNSRESAPRNVRVSHTQARGRVEGASMQDIREAMQPRVGSNTKRVAVNGLNVAEIIRATPWIRRN